ncbi:MAG TPA: PDZ domain-containing protein [Firmicutes bacterium]|nr:PDZ domain-containing protein [Bacillota bacterium]
MTLLDSYWQTIRLLVRSLPYYLQREDFLLIIGVVLLLVYGQYSRIAGYEKRLFGAVLHPAWPQLWRSLGMGLIGGLLATAIFIFTGIPLSGAGLWYVWLVAILLALWHPRFICFSYAGGFIALAGLIWPQAGINPPAIMALVAVLHLVEALLIKINGDYGAMPVYVRYRPDMPDMVVGGFVLQRFWPIPLIALVAVWVAGDLPAGEHAVMPDWWPLIRPQAVSAATDLNPVFTMIPVVAALGYSDLVLTCEPRHKAGHTAFLLSLFSLVLLGLAYLAQFHPLFVALAALFSIAGHEAVIHLGRRRELLGKPLYQAEAGAMVMDVLPGSPAAVMGLTRGDIIRRINGEPIRSKADVARAIEPWLIGMEMEVTGAFDGRTRTLYYKGKVPPLGVLLVPEAGDLYFLDPYQERGGLSLVRRWWRRLTGGSRHAR